MRTAILFPRSLLTRFGTTTHHFNRTRLTCTMVRIVSLLTVLIAVQAALLAGSGVFLSAQGTASGNLEAVPDSIDVGEASTLTASNLLNVGAHVAFVLEGPIHFNASCSDSAARSIDGPVGSSGSTAERTVYGCAPGGIATARLTTTGGVELDSVTITVNRPPPSGDLSVSKKVIDVGEAATVTATNLLNVGTHVTFALSGPIHFNQSCTDDASGATGGARGTRSGSAQTTVYGCAPGGAATVRLTTNEGIQLDTITITVNPPLPSGDLSATSTAIRVGQSTTLTASNLVGVGSHVALELTGPIHFNVSCTSGSLPRSGDTASRLIYGCAPGGTATVRLTTTAGIELDRDYHLRDWLVEWRASEGD